MGPLGLCTLAVDAMKQDDIWFATSDISVGEGNDFAWLLERSIDIHVAKESPKDE
jgi:hypothetical protein